MARYVPVHLRRDPKPLVPITNFRRSPSPGPQPLVPQAHALDDAGQRLAETQDRHEAWRADMEALAAALTAMFGPLS